MDTTDPADVLRWLKTFNTDGRVIEPFGGMLLLIVLFSSRRYLSV